MENIILFHKGGTDNTMNGYPKILNTREDYDYVHANFPKEMWVQDFKNLLEEQYVFNFKKYLEPGETVHLDVPYYIEDEEYEENGEMKTRKALFVREILPGNKMEQLGFTAEEVMAIINS